MSKTPFDFKNKKDRNDFFIALLVILFFSWLFYFFNYQRSGDLDFMDEEVAIANVGADVGDYDGDGILNINDTCPYKPGLADADGCPKDQDGDGIEDYYDRCPTTIGIKKNKGCPDLIGKDIDGDGFIGEADLCPDIAGTDAGCPPDADKDGIPNEKDNCPQRAGTVENGGCPPDQDLDGVPDGIDKCPEVPGIRENKGCPADTDKDGVYDLEDRCPKIAGVATNAGCPADKDKDGVYDKVDKCPNEKGPASNGGCPVKAVVADKDGDGVPDAEDKCPNRAGPAASNGCPEVEMTVAEKKVISDAIDKVVFLSASPNLTEYSKGLVISIAALMKKYPEAKLKISGHTDSIGENAGNLVLSRSRAATCLNLLVQQGIARGRMSSEGFGETKPIANNNTKEGRQKNRRVEFELYY